MVDFKGLYLCCAMAVLGYMELVVIVSMLSDASVGVLPSLWMAAFSLALPGGMYGAYCAARQLADEDRKKRKVGKK